MADLLPEHPEDAGVESEIPDQSHIEGAELLANQARPIMRDMGFDDDEILDWVETYVAQKGSGDVDSLIKWIAETEGS